MSASPFAIGSDVWPGTAKAVEEVSELAQVLGKLIASGGRVEHWDGSDLRERLVDELGDVRAAMRLLIELNELPEDAIAEREQIKLERFRGWHASSRPPSTDPHRLLVASCGCLVPHGYTPATHRPECPMGEPT